jgi:hypothetical protein
MYRSSAQTTSYKKIATANFGGIYESDARSGSNLKQSGIIQERVIRSSVPVVRRVLAENYTPRQIDAKDSLGVSVPTRVFYSTGVQVELLPLQTSEKEIAQTPPKNHILTSSVVQDNFKDIQVLKDRPTENFPPESKATINNTEFSSLIHADLSQSKKQRKKPNIQVFNLKEELRIAYEVIFMRRSTNSKDAKITEVKIVQLGTRD